MKCIMNLKNLSEKLAGHRILALNRGEKEKFLTVKVRGTGRRNPALIWKRQVIANRKSIYNGSIKRERWRTVITV